MGKMIQEKPGNRYNWWTVLSFDKVDSHRDARFWCRCELCGNHYSVKGYTLRNGTSTKCVQCAKKR